MSREELRTDRLVLRRWRDGDVEPFAVMNADPEVMEFFPEPLDAESSQALVARIEAGFTERGFGLWALEVAQSGEFIGFTGLSVPGFEAGFTPAVEVGWRLARRAWGRGYATEAATGVLDAAFGPLALAEVVSFTSMANRRSQAVMRRLGMTRDRADDFGHPSLPPWAPARCPRAISDHRSGLARPHGSYRPAPLAVSGMAGHDSDVSTAENYRRFARIEAAGRSPAYEHLAYAVAGDAQILAFLDGLPPAKRQPNLLFAAARLLIEEPADAASLRTLVEERGGQLAEVMLARSTQTNEPARCAVLLPALAALPGPLALIEVGAAAGLCLLVDYYNYDYAGQRVHGLDAAAPTLSCAPLGAVPVRQQVPEIVWRAGLDLNPLDVTNPADLTWLECLLWPGEQGRARRLAAAADTARAHAVAVHQGDLLDDLTDLAAQAPAEATLVIYHSAVLTYVNEADRRRFAAAVASMGAVWLANEAPGILPDTPVPPAGQHGFVLIKDGRELLARSDPHGSWVHWLA